MVRAAPRRRAPHPPCAACVIGAVRLLRRWPHEHAVFASETESERERERATTAVDVQRREMSCGEMHLDRGRHGEGSAAACAVRVASGARRVVWRHAAAGGHLTCRPTPRRHRPGGGLCALVKSKNDEKHSRTHAPVGTLATLLARSNGPTDAHETRGRRVRQPRAHTRRSRVRLRSVGLLELARQERPARGTGSRRTRAPGSAA